MHLAELIALVWICSRLPLASSDSWLSWSCRLKRLLCAPLPVCLFALSRFALWLSVNPNYRLCTARGSRSASSFTVGPTLCRDVVHGFYVVVHRLVLLNLVLFLRFVARCGFPLVQGSLSVYCVCFWRVRSCSTCLGLSWLAVTGDLVYR